MKKIDYRNLSLRGFFTQKLLSTEAFIYRDLFTQKFYHTETFTHRVIYTEQTFTLNFFSCRGYTHISQHKTFHTQRLLLTYRNFDTQTLLHTKAFCTQTTFYIEGFAYRHYIQIFPQTRLYKNFFLHKKTHSHLDIFTDSYFPHTNILQTDVF